MKTDWMSYVQSRYISALYLVHDRTWTELYINVPSKNYGVYYLMN